MRIDKRRNPTSAACQQHGSQIKSILARLVLTLTYFPQYLHVALEEVPELPLAALLVEGCSGGGGGGGGKC
jgi:hypothetical protein